MYTPIGTAERNDIDPQAWLADLLDRIAPSQDRKAFKSSSFDPQSVWFPEDRQHA